MEVVKWEKRKKLGQIVVLRQSGEDGCSFPITKKCIVIGSCKEKSDIQIHKADVVLPVHCQVTVDEKNDFYITNLAPAEKAPVELNGKRLNCMETVKMSHKDVVAVENKFFKLTVEGARSLDHTPVSVSKQKGINQRKSSQLTTSRGEISAEKDVLLKQSVKKGPPSRIQSQNIVESGIPHLKRPSRLPLSRGLAAKFGVLRHSNSRPAAVSSSGLDSLELSGEFEEVALIEAPWPVSDEQPHQEDFVEQDQSGEGNHDHDEEQPDQIEQNETLDATQNVCGTEEDREAEGESSMRKFEEPKEMENGSKQGDNDKSEKDDKTAEVPEPPTAVDVSQVSKRSDGHPSVDQAYTPTQPPLELDTDSLARSSLSRSARLKKRRDSQDLNITEEKTPSPSDTFLHTQEDSSVVTETDESLYSSMQSQSPFFPGHLSLPKSSGNKTERKTRRKSSSGESTLGLNQLVSEVMSTMKKECSGKKVTPTKKLSPKRKSRLSRSPPETEAGESAAKDKSKLTPRPLFGTSRTPKSILKSLKSRSGGKKATARKSVDGTPSIVQFNSEVTVESIPRRGKGHSVKEFEEMEKKRMQDLKNKTPQTTPRVAKKLRKTPPKSMPKLRKRSAGEPVVGLEVEDEIELDNSAPILTPMLKSPKISKTGKSSEKNKKSSSIRSFSIATPTRDANERKRRKMVSSEEIKQGKTKAKLEIAATTSPSPNYSRIIRKTFRESPKRRSARIGGLTQLFKSEKSAPNSSPDPEALRKMFAEKKTKGKAIAPTPSPSGMKRLFRIASHLKVKALIPSPNPTQLKRLFAKSRSPKSPRLSGFTDIFEQTRKNVTFEIEEKRIKPVDPKTNKESPTRRSSRKKAVVNEGPDLVLPAEKADAAVSHKPTTRTRKRKSDITEQVDVEKAVVSVVQKRSKVAAKSEKSQGTDEMENDAKASKAAGKGRTSKKSPLSRSTVRVTRKTAKKSEQQKDETAQKLEKEAPTKRKVEKKPRKKAEQMAETVEEEPVKTQPKKSRAAVKGSVAKTEKPQQTKRGAKFGSATKTTNTQARTARKAPTAGKSVKATKTESPVGRRLRSAK